MKYGKNVLLLGDFFYMITIILITAFIVVSLVMLGSSISGGRSSRAADLEKGQKYYTSIEIKPGDSLWSIATEYMSEEYENVQEYIEDIKAFNGMGDDTIHSGRYIIIPYYLH